MSSVKWRIFFMMFVFLGLEALLTYASMYSTYQENKEAFLDRQHLTFTLQAENIENLFIDIENNVKLLESSITMRQYVPRAKREPLQSHLKNFLSRQATALGCGIWYENFSQSDSCNYMYMNEDSGLSLDDSPSVAQTNSYRNQSWYREIKENTEFRGRVFWSRPYEDSAFSHVKKITAGCSFRDEKGSLQGLVTLDLALDDITEILSSLLSTPDSIAVLAHQRENYVVASVPAGYKNYTWLYEQKSSSARSVQIGGQDYYVMTYTLANRLILGVALSKEPLLADLAFSFWITSGIYIAIVLGCSFILFRTMTHFVINPINKLSHAASAIGRGDFTYRIAFQGNTEFSVLANSMNTMAKELDNTFTLIKKLNLEQERAQAELDIARSIQEGMLPSPVPTEAHEEFSLYAYMRTAKEVGGDFFDHFLIDENHLVIVVADVSGKGISAALFMATAKSFLHSHLRDVSRPSSAITKTNIVLCENNKANMFVSIWLGILDLRRGKLRFCNAGHNRPMLAQNGKCAFLQGESNFVVGALADEEYVDEEVLLSSGDVLMLYTDGVNEALNKEEDYFGNTRMLDCFSQHIHEDPETAVQAMVHTLDSFSCGAEQTDDITILALSYYGNDREENLQEERDSAVQENLEDGFGDIYSFSVPADLMFFPVALEKMTKILNFLHCPLMLRNRVYVVFEEIFVNVASYAYPTETGNLVISVEKTLFPSHPKGGIRLCFRDKGIPFNPVETDEPDFSLSLDEQSPGGLGLTLVKKMMDKVWYEYRDSENVLTMEKFI